MELNETITFPSLIIGLGILHAFDADHLLAVSSLTETMSRPRKVLAICSYWALGHGLTLLVVGASTLLLGMAAPDRLSHFAEELVGLMLICIGLQALWKLIGQTTSNDVPTSFTNQMRCTSLDKMSTVPVYGKHKSTKSAVFVGMIHGLAGSAPLLALIPLTNHESPWLGLSYLIFFSLGVLISMLAFGGFLGVIFDWLKKRVLSLLSVLHAIIAIGTICLGGYWIIGNS